MLMTRIREKLHIVLYLLVFFFIALIVVEWGANYSDIARSSRGVVGRVDGEDIRYADFHSALYNQSQLMQQQRGGEPLNESEMDNVSEQIWEQIVEQQLLQKLVREANLAASDSEIVFHLRYNPPDFLRQNPSFQTDGNFDQVKYLQALNNPQYAKAWTDIERALRAQLPFSKAQSLITSTVRVTEGELRQEYARRHLTVSGRLVFFSPAAVPVEQVNVTDDDLQAYYDAHLDDFKQPERARLVHVSFSDKPTASDSAEIFARLDDIKKQFAEGKDFAELAKIYSEEPGATESGGDLGWFGRNRMVKPFEDACFGAKAGDIVGPIETQFGYHIIKVEETKFKPRKKDAPDEDSVKARHILVRMAPSNNTVETARENATAFYEEAKSNGWTSAMAKYGERFALRADTTAEITNNEFGMIAGFQDRMRQVLRFAFSNDVGSVSPPHRTSSGFTTFGIANRSKAGIQPLDDVRERIRNLVTDEKRKELAFTRAQDVRTKIQVLEEIRLADTSLVITEFSGLALNGSISGVGRDTKINGQLFQLTPGALSAALKGARGSYIVQLSRRDEFKEQLYQDKRGELKEQLLNAKRQRAYREWLEAMKKAVDIEDFRADFNL
jgi:peptidylprolyl isomerase/peptidyl-prolyl cis-trans isomerase D